MVEVSQGLTRLGLDPTASDGVNLRRLWHLYQEKELELGRIEEKQKKEMQAVEKYIENIRKVSEERDALTEDLEAENEALKDEVRQLRNELNGQKQDVRGTLKKGQQTQAKSVLEKAVQDSKEKEKKIRSLDGEVKKLKFALLMEKRRKTVAKSGEGDSRGRAGSRTESKIPLPMKQVPDKESTDKKVKELTDTLEAERKKKSTHEGTIIKLKALFNKNKKEIGNLQQEKKELEQEKNSLGKQLVQFQSNTKLSGSEVEALSTQNQELSLTGKSSGSITGSHRDLEQLWGMTNGAEAAQPDSKMVSLEEERRKCNKLEERLRETEEKWEGVVSRYRSSEEELKVKLSSLSREVERGKSENASSQREITRLKSTQGEVTDTSIKSEVEQLTLQLIKEQEQIRDLRRDLGESEHLKAQVGDMRKDRDALAKELQTVIAREQKNQVNTATMESENKSLKDQLNENLKNQSDLIQDLNKLQKKNSDLSADLTDAKDSIRSSEETIKFLREELSRKSKQLTDTFDFTRDGQSKMESEVVNLLQTLDDERKSLHHANSDLNFRLKVEEHKNQKLSRAPHEKTELGLCLLYFIHQGGFLAVGNLPEKTNIHDKSTAFPAGLPSV